MSLSGFIVRNWRLKIAAFVLAVLLWVTMRLSDDRVSRLSLPNVEVRVEQVHRDWYLRQAPFPSTVEMSVSGPIGELLRVAMSQPAIVVRVDSVLKEDSVLTLIPDWVSNVDRSSVTIENFAPSSVRLLFERNKEEEIPVSVRLIGTLPDSLAMVNEPRANLLFARVRGAASSVDALETVFLEPFDLGSVTGPGRFEVPVDTAGLDGLVVSPTTATLTVDASTRTTRSLLSLIELAGAGDDLALEPAAVTVTLFGAEERLGAVDSAAVQVLVNVDPEELRRQLEEDAAVRVPLTLSGLPRWVEGTLGVDSVTVRGSGTP